MVKNDILLNYDLHWDDEVKDTYKHTSHDVDSMLFHLEAEKCSRTLSRSMLPQAFLQRDMTNQSLAFS